MKWMTVILVDSSGQPYSGESVRVTSATGFGQTHEDKFTNSRGEAEFACADEKITVFARGQRLYEGYPQATVKVIA